MRGREQQIADLTVLELYKLAYASCTFTDDRMLTDADVNRRKQLENYLLSSEKILRKDCQTLEKEYLKRLTERQLNDLMIHISIVDTNEQNLEKSPDQSDDEYDDIGMGCLAFRGLFTSDNKEEKTILSRSINFLSISEAMDNWRDNGPTRELHQSQTTNNSNNVFSTTQSIVQVIPRLFTMNIALTQDFALKFDVREISWIFIGIATIAGCMVGFVGGIYLLSSLIGYILISAAGGVMGGGAAAIAECLREVHLEYMKILLLVAKSLGVIMDQVRMHQYCLEEKISSIYRKKFEELPSTEHIFAKWENMFPVGVLNKIRSRDKQNYCLSIVRCIDANFQMRKLLSKDFALGVIGPGKSGKSTLLKNMFGFNTNPDKEIRTEDLHTYRVNEDFRVIDFPHMTSVFDYVKNCFTCNHNLVNAIIVVLNAEQGGNDIKGEGYVVKEVKKLVKKGVDVLFCFNQCDKLALKKRSKNVQQNIDKFSLYANDEIEQTNASNENDEYEYWTQEHVEEKRRQWAKNYEIDLDKCWMTFCELEETDQAVCRNNYRKLVSIKLQTYNDIKNKWLKQVLEENAPSDNASSENSSSENSLSKKSINEIMNFRYADKQ